MPALSQPSALITLFENTATNGSGAASGLRDRLCAALRQAINSGALAGVETPRLSPLFTASAGVVTQPQDGWLLGFSALTPAEITAAVNRLASLKVPVI